MGLSCNERALSIHKWNEQGILPVRRKCWPHPCGQRSCACADKSLRSFVCQIPRVASKILRVQVGFIFLGWNFRENKPHGYLQTLRSNQASIWPLKALFLEASRLARISRKSEKAAWAWSE